ncbi:hypothetical protein BU16DRAFT_70975 [Lophium mytilinum]|uniref:Uncharacterized protein n=1 Tax=Lophium mytilinum TaxID=390894 RepID=A0A6A6QTU0_9PEZI|nr:hypothetical protein BU16DRAFT_70975 [Lophium mytilinum]
MAKIFYGAKWGTRRRLRWRSSASTLSGCWLLHLRASGFSPVFIFCKLNTKAESEEPPPLLLIRARRPLRVLPLLCPIFSSSAVAPACHWHAEAGSTWTSRCWLSSLVQPCDENGLPANCDDC